jgi:membrane protein
VWQAIKDFLEDGCTVMAAALSFYTLFAIPPLLALLTFVAATAVPPETVREILSEQIQNVAGPGGAVQIIDLIEEARRPDVSQPVAWIGLLTLIFSATGVLVQLQSALNSAWHVSTDPNRSKIRTFLLKRLVSLALLAGFGFMLLVSLAVSTILAGFGDIVEQSVPTWISKWVLQTADFVFSLAVISLLFTVIFQYVPDAKVRWRDALAGGAFTGLFFTIGKVLIGYYIGRSDPGSVFGAAGSLAVALLWVYFSTMILLFGAEFTQSWASERGQPIVPSEGAVGIRRIIEPTA